MNYHYLDMEHYPRRGQFDYFRNMAYPYAGMTVPLDITELMDCIKENGWPFFSDTAVPCNRYGKRDP